MSYRKIRSILMIFLISVVGTSILSMFLYNISTQIIKMQIEKQKESSLINLSNQVSNFQDRISQAVIDLQNTQDYQMFIESMPFKDYASSAAIIRNFVNRLQTMNATLDYVDSITFYNLENGRKYITNGGVNDELQFREIIAKFKDLQAPQALMDTGNNGALSAIYIQALPLFQLKPQGYLIFHYNSRFLSRLLQNEQSGGSYIVVNEKHQIIDRYSRDGKQERSVELPEKLWEPSSIIGDHVRAVSDHGYFYILHQPPNKAWSYIYSIEEAEALAPIIRLRNIVLLSTAALLLLSLLLYALSIHISWKGWSRISALIADSKEVQSKDDFEVLFHKIQGLTHNHNQLRDHMNVILPEAKDAFIKNMLEKGCSKRDFVKMKQYNIALGNHPYQVFCLEADDYKTMRELYSETDMRHFEYGIACVIQEVMNEVDIPGLVVVESQARFVGIYETDKQNGEAPFNAALQKIRSFVQQYFPFTVTIGVSQMRSDLTHLNLSYNESLESLKQKLIVGANEVIYFTNFLRKESIFSSDVHEIENDIVHGIRDKNRELAYIALNRLVDIKKAENVDYRSLQNYLINMVLFLFRELAGDLRFINQMSMSEIVRLSTLEEWTEWIRTHCIDCLIEDIIQNEKKQYDRIADKLVQYMHGHLEEDLRLHEVCKQLGISVNLANGALKEVHGMTFTEYLFQCRIELSKKWLRETQMNLDEISNFLFYSNAQNFSRAFKKYVGLPPGLYRKQHQTSME
ncbi:helix-turn-helix domain-containing protein [Paenibacillus piri]|uniref:Helix-turn-helix domain-containing protein n=1 Tax=Paenibacillus piri TaxID=2547395 RepID=A0A4R5K7G2_9BACL|nr:helix-turn-helix domain-containing protein [Paenibacillus piri]TDF90116.1 helix-turn-helix domain-containing protein [Paenibacillus piri]